MKKLFKKIAILAGIVWILLFIIWLTLSTVILIKKDEISRYLILHVNQIQNGELNIGKVSFSPISQFPHISIILEDVTYYEHKEILRKESEQPIAKIDNFYCGLEILKLFKGQLQISKVNFNGGEISIIIYPDSSINLINAFKADSVVKKKDTIQTKKTESQKSVEYISIEELEIIDIKLIVTNNPEKKESIILFKHLESAIDYANNQASVNFSSSILIEKLKINEDHFIKDQEIEVDVASYIDKEKGLEVKEGKINIAETSFNFTGIFNPIDEGKLSLKFVTDGNMNIFSLFVNQDVAKNLTKGEFYFFGFIDGKIFSEFPLITFDFGFKNVELVNPVTKRTIKNLNMKGYFNSGRLKDLSEARLKIDTLYADFQNGRLNLAGSIKNLIKPAYDINLYLNADVTGLDDVFELGSVDSIKGKVVIKDQINGFYDISKNRFSNNISEAAISLENFGFVIPNTIRFDNITGTISRKGDLFFLNDLKIKSKSTDFNVDGKIDNIQYLIFGIEKEITANLEIKSSILDLPNFLAFDPSIKRDFPHRILNLDLLVDATTTTSKALHFKSFPQINFDIKKLDATAEDFIPPLVIKSGIFKVSEDVLGFHLDFNEFKTKFLDGDFNFSGNYTSSKFLPYYIKSNIEMDDIKISKLLSKDENDSIPDLFKSKMYGSCFVELQFSDDSTEIKLFKIKNGDLNYFYGNDTIETKSLRFNSEGIDFSLEENSNPLATLFATGNFTADKVKTSEFIVSDVDYVFNVKNGEYFIETKKPKFFGINAKGEMKYSLKPFSETPTYNIYSNLSSFNLQEMMYVFLKDTSVSGNLSLYINVSMQGNNWDEMLSTMNGEINLGGKNLIFYGVDADKLIEEFQRSQNFNLVDAGAVLLAGPVGLAITKGSDFAKILITKPGELSHITHLVSNWNAKNGLLTLTDVAASTKKNRVAAKGWINIVADSLAISFAVINDYGCSIFTQDVFGDLNKPTLGKVKVVSTLLAPVTNLYKSVMDVDCPVFYKGTLPPIKSK